MPADHPQTRRGKARRRNRQQDARRETNSIESSDTESDGGLVKPALVFVVGTVVGWGAYLFSALAVLSYPTDVEAVSVTGLSMSTTFWIAVVLLAIIIFAMLAKPGTVFAGWLLMAGVVAVVASSGGGWTDGLLLIEGLTVAFVVIAAFVKLLLMLPDWYLFAHALNKS
ncbi:hypothetical protein C451_04456 [Halococcus thailandensis JCM 13552]|uniref:Uncharacterized protein n=1 Tax=Halococcus thailandensis JCM 13552 TaxID=1227457 RepID=M0NER1_9EURY|nr:hypothetical protein C451_04456 [Halococcus thailandensis JCM 13552]